MNYECKSDNFYPLLQFSNGIFYSIILLSNIVEICSADDALSECGAQIAGCQMEEDFLRQFLKDMASPGPTREK